LCGNCVVIVVVAAAAVVSYFSTLAAKYSPILGFSNQQD
jgi:hypothetical protein